MLKGKQIKTAVLISELANIELFSSRQKKFFFYATFGPFCSAWERPKNNDPFFYHNLSISEAFAVSSFFPESISGQKNKRIESESDEHVEKKRVIFCRVTLAIGPFFSVRCGIRENGKSSLFPTFFVIDKGKEKS